jgi:hypothetical protein
MWLDALGFPLECDDVPRLSREVSLSVKMM